MSLREEIDALQAQLDALKDRVDAEEDEAIEEAEKLMEQIDEKKAALVKMEKKAAILNVIGKSEEPEEEKEMNVFEELAKKAAEMIDRKSGVSVHVKAADTVVTAPQIADLDRSLAPKPQRISAADFFSNATISGNAITYFMQGAYEGTPTIVGQGEKKTQNSTSFAPTTLALSKIAAYIKETDEILWDADFLASEVQNSLVYRVGVVEDTTIVNTVANASGTLSVEIGTGDNSFADALVAAIMAIKDASAYDASVIMLNPADYLALIQAKDGNNQYYGGGYFSGAYAQGNFGLPTAVWGVPVFTNSNITAGTAVVAAREAVKVWRKGGLDVKVYEQNEDDAIHNRVTLLAEERLACAVVDLNGVCVVSNS